MMGLVELHYCYNCQRQHCISPIMQNPSKLSNSRKGITTTISRKSMTPSYKRKNIDLQLVSNIQESLFNSKISQLQSPNKGSFKLDQVNKVLGHMKKSIQYQDNQVPQNRFVQKVFDKQQPINTEKSNKTQFKYSIEKRKKHILQEKTFVPLQNNNSRKLIAFEDFKNQFAFLSEIKNKRDETRPIIRLNSQNKSKMKQTI